MKVNTSNEGFSVGFNVNSVVSFPRHPQLTLGTVGLISNYPMPRGEIYLTKEEKFSTVRFVIMFVVKLKFRSLCSAAY